VRGERRAHLLTKHGIDMEKELLRWPDGEPVIVDTTLEAGDFDD
jgi:hypothetical protein